MNNVFQRVVFDGELSIVVGGEAGQGIQTIEALLSRLFARSGLHVYASKEYMSRVRGGSNSTQIRISSRPVAAYVRRIDILLALDADAIGHLAERTGAQTIIIGERSLLGDVPGLRDVAFSTIAAAAGGPLYANTAAAGVLAALCGIDRPTCGDFIAGYFAKKGKESVEKNRAAFSAGYDAGAAIAREGVTVRLGLSAGAPARFLAGGADGLTMGALAGGCDFISSYPMTPGTALLTNLSKHAAAFGIVAEQAEDEIAAVNMAVAAWYTGARAIVTTSGGGFALMTEGLSLAGMMESPLVVNIGQRPGPATGLPTRTEQGDLNLALYAGHGEFPRVILAPRDTADAFACLRDSFDIADRFQLPVIILSDQYLADAVQTMDPFDLPAAEPVRHVVPAAGGYRRYAVTGRGISPRALPGSGPGLVCADSDEHDENGRITESPAVRTVMMEKRMRKLDLARAAAIVPVLSGDPAYQTLIVGWGSVCPALREAAGRLARAGLGLLEFTQVYPLHADAAGYLKKAERVIVVEQNYTGQFARLLAVETGAAIMGSLRTYDGSPFGADELEARLAEMLGGRP